MAGYVAEFGKDGRLVEPDGRLDAPAFHRNHRPIREVLSAFLAGKSGDVLEAGSGTGQHVVYFARHTPEITWWPSDLNAQHLKSIDRVARACGAFEYPCPQADRSLRAGMVAEDEGRPGRLLAIVCANVIHIAPWRVAEGLFAGAARHLGKDGRLFLYGPFKRDGEHTATEQCRVRHQPARAGDPEWGVRDIADLAATGRLRSAGLVLARAACDDAGQAT